ncbi:Dps family protein [Aquimarina muelleri]|uniref:DNA starvation/stationary phase protection protein n=1 Tax=Aquimarina muelleri TaxID=279356 RepID=A0A918JZS3_9FLAO|nr:DNA starvation/stationary phase protection protein [Aquimarina muelleri]MCX2764991.1 DNA starvation/stationary phase protection protein [Aquimarina muelleri]GGX34869.1 DNA starvation/stationary phase protection protein [Aquimarina muelleri]
MNYLNMNEKKLLPVVLELNVLLADYNLYYQKLRGFHWNILGKNFFDLHHKFEELYNNAKVKIDDIAERILTLQHHPVSQFKEYIKIATVKEVSPLLKDTEMVKELLQDHKKLLMQMRVVLNHAEEANDEGTIDMLGAYIGELEKLSWMLNAWHKDTSDSLDTSLIEQA